MGTKGQREEGIKIRAAPVRKRTMPRDGGTIGKKGHREDGIKMWGGACPPIPSIRTAPVRKCCSADDRCLFRTPTVREGRAADR